MAPPESPAAWDHGLGDRLHFHLTLEYISTFCASGLAARALREFWPTEDEELLRQRFDLTAEIVTLLERKTTPPSGEIPNVASFNERIAHGSALSTEDLGNLRNFLALADQLGSFFKKQEQVPRLRELSGDLHPWPGGRPAIDKILDTDLTIRDDASPELKRLRSAVRRKRSQVQKRMGTLHSQAIKEGWAQDDPVAWRDGRSVIVLKVSHKRKLGGLIHGYSASGGSAFVEPLEVFDLNNEIGSLNDEVFQEEARILRAITDEYRPFVPAMDSCLQGLVLADTHLAVARWAMAEKAVQPAINRSAGIVLKGARNPVLAQHRAVVPLDIRLDNDRRILVISGPNAGGKTVVVLTVGLLQMMAQSGLYIPADEASFPLLSALYTDLGDQQSMEDDLSTFSAHLLNLKAITEACDRRVMVLLDELGTGTEPEAGAALARMFMEQISGSGAWCLATTHLNRLKMWAQEAGGVENAAMEFDQRELRPTYRLQQGHPGTSYALEIARRMGLQQALLDRAQELLPESTVNMEDLLVALEEERSGLAEARAKYDRLVVSNQQRQEEIVTREAEIKRQFRRARKDAVAEAEQLVQAANRNLERAVAEVREKTKDLSKEDIAQARQIINAERKHLAGEREALADLDTPALDFAAIREGDWVQVADQAGVAQVAQVHSNRREVTLESRGKRLRVAMDRLLPGRAPLEEDAPETAFTGSHKLAGPAGHRLDMRGERGEAAVAELDKFLNRALVAGIPELEVIHGKGTGILQKLVHEFLGEHPSVKSFAFANFDAGGTGVTIVKL